MILKRRVKSVYNGYGYTNSVMTKEVENYYEAKKMCRKRF